MWMSHVYVTTLNITFSTKLNVVPELGGEPEAGSIGIIFHQFLYVHGQNWKKISWGYIHIKGEGSCDRKVRIIDEFE